MTFVHPELEEGEFLLTNCSLGFFPTCAWKTKRLGRNAYDLEGKVLDSPINRLYPLFIQRAEHEEYFKKQTLGK